MQLLARLSSAGTAYTAAQVVAEMASPARQDTYEIDRLDNNLRWLADLSPYVDMGSGQVEHDRTRAVRRTLRLKVSAEAVFDPLRDLVRPRYRLRMTDGGWVEWSLGVFTMIPTGREITPGRTWISLEGGDLTQLLADAGFLQSTGVPAYTDVVAGASALITSYNGVTPLQTVIPGANKVLPTAFGWEYGNNPLVAANDLMAAINYLSISADEEGRIVSRAVPDWNTVSPAIAFDTTGSLGMAGTGAPALSVPGLVLSPIARQPDYSKAFNVAIVVVEDPRRGAFTLPVYNTRADSPIAIGKWHIKTQVIKDSRIIDRSTAQARGIAELQEAARAYDPVVIQTLPWPVWQDYDICGLTYSNPDEGVVSDKFLVSKWTHRMGGFTNHTLERVVPAGQ